MARYKKREIDLDRVMQMRAEGMTLGKISKELGVSTASLNEKMRAAGLTKPHEVYLDKGKIMELHRAKRTPAWIARDMRITIQTVNRVIAEHKKGA